MEIVTKTQKQYSVTLAFLFVLLVIFTSLIYSFNVRSQSYENEYGVINVWPSISKGFIRQRQFYNYTWYYPDNTGTVAFVFDEPLSYGKVTRWDGVEYVAVQHSHQEISGRHAYIIDNVPLITNELVEGYWEYDVPAGTDGKWDMYIKLASDTWQTAFAQGRIVHLDPWWNNSWSYYVLVDVDNAQVEGALDAYELIVPVPPSIGAKCDGGNSVRFVGLDNTTVYEGYDIINVWDDSAYNYIAINVSSFQATTQLLMYYNNSGASGTEDEHTCWNASYQTVHHFEESGNNEDSTSNNNDLTNTGASQVAALVGYGKDLEQGESDYLTLDNELDGNSALTVEILYRYENTQDPVGSIVTTNYNTDNFNQIVWFLYTDANDDLLFKGSDDSGYLFQLSYATTLSNGEWYHITGTWDGTSAWLYMNGTLVASDLTAAGTFTDHASAETHVGAEEDAGSQRFYGDGVTDQLRILNVAREPEYVYTYYNNINNLTGATPFVTLGTEQVGAPVNWAPGETAIIPANGSTTVSVHETTIYVTIEDFEGDQFNWTIDTSPDVGNSSANETTNGTKTCTISGLLYGQVITWYLNATDVNDNWNYTSYTFTVQSNTCPSSASENPTNRSTSVDVLTSLFSLVLSDLNMDTITWNIDVNNSDINSGSGANGSKTCTITNLAYSTNYSVWVNYTDGNCTVNESFWFVTESEAEATGITTYQLSWEETQFGIIISIILFIFFFWVGYNSPKRSGGGFMMFSAFLFFSIEILTTSILNAVLVIPLFTPIGIYILLLGIRKQFFPVANEKTKTEGK